MKPFHTMNDLLAAGVVPTSDEAADLALIGRFTAGMFDRYLHGAREFDQPLGRVDLGFDTALRPDVLSAATAMRWAKEMCASDALFSDSAHTYWNPPRAGYTGLDGGERSWVDIIDESANDVPEVSGVSAPK